MKVSPDIFSITCLAVCLCQISKSSSKISIPAVQAAMKQFSEIALCRYRYNVFRCCVMYNQFNAFTIQYFLSYLREGGVDSSSNWFGGFKKDCMFFLTLWLHVSCWAGDNTGLPLNSNIFKTVTVNTAFTITVFK